MRIVFLIVLFLLSTVSFGQTMGDLKPTVSMKEYVDMQAQLNKEWMQKLVEIQFQNINDNVDKANATMDKRLDGMNEFRQTLKDSNETYITRSELIAWASAILFAIGFIFKTFIQPQQNSTKNIQSGDNVTVKK